MSASLEVPGTAIVVLVAGVAAAVYVWKKGGVAQAASALGASAVNVAGAAAAGAVGAAGAAVGLPTPDQTTTDPAVARYLVDRMGWLYASKWSSAGALFTAASMDAGSGKPPPPDSAIAKALPALTTGDFTRTDHDTSPADPAQAFVNATPAPLPGFSANDPANYGIGL